MLSSPAIPSPPPLPFRSLLRRSPFLLVAFSFSLSLSLLPPPSLAENPPPASAVSAAAPVSPEAAEFFEKNIRPVLAERCYKCHSAAAGKVKANLRLDTRELTLKGGDSGPALVPGDADASLLMRAIRYLDSDLAPMPPDGKLADSEIENIRAWIAMGAPDPRSDAPAASAPADAPAKPKIDLEAARKFWSFTPPADPAPPAVKNEASIATPVDRFILAKLEEKGLSPAPPAEKRALIRRATFDLIGLPPEPADVEAFLADDSPDAFAKVVERLLASPHYGERWGRHWLDVVRYTDSFDSRATPQQDCAEAWRYRDWVVGAMNADMPYDHFVKMQIAGDLLPAPGAPPGFNREGIIATGMLAIGNWPGGDADKEKMVTDIVDDQIDVVTRGIMGATLACARCHDHKFDPFSTEDYYGLAGVFFSSRILPGPGAKTEGSPILKIPLLAREELDARARREARIKEIRGLLEKAAERRNAAAARAMLGQTAEYLLAAADWRAAAGEPSPEDFAAARGLDPAALRGWVRYLGLGDEMLLSKASRDVLSMPGLNAWQTEKDLPSVVANASPEERKYLTITHPANALTAHPGPGAPVAIAWKSPLSGEVAITGRVIDADPNCGDGVGWAIDLRSRAGARRILEGAINSGDLLNLADVAGAEALKRVAVRAGESLEMVISPKGDHSCDTTVVEFRIEELSGERRYWNLTEDVVPDLLEDGKGNPHKDKYGAAGIWRFIDLGEDNSRAPAPEGSALAQFQAVFGAAEAGDPLASRAALESAALALERAALAPPPGEASPDAKLWEELRSIRSPFWGAGLGPGPGWGGQLLAPARAELAALEAQTPPPIEYAVGIQEGGVPTTEHEKPRDARVHIRGSYARLGDVVPRRAPEVLSDAPPIRPGEGSSGRRELAEWVGSAENPLTARVMANRIWQQHFGEGIVRTPGNFGALGERPTHPELLDWLARRFVESGWSVKSMHRLLMLSSAYRQSSRAPRETLEADPGNRLFSRANRRRLEAEELRDALLAASGALDRTLGGPPVAELAAPRRTLYLKTVRSDRATFNALFDAADPTAITDKRAESTVAPQALFMLNNPFAIDQARRVAESALASASPSEAARIAALYLRLYARPPSESELSLGAAALARGGAGAPSADGARAELAAWPPYVQALLCANEFMYVD